jgi:bleomycin hydrolase
MRKSHSMIGMATMGVVFAFQILFAQDIHEGTITPEMLLQIQSSDLRLDASKALMNAVTNNEIQKLALNREHLGWVDHHFAVKIETEGITDQKSSGRCWLFTGLNVLRPKVIQKYELKSFEFSENYCFFWDQLEKANLFLEGIIETRDREIDDRKVEWLFKHPISDGGVWNMVVALVEKYGLVPKEAMPESQHSENTRMMNRLLRRKLREDGLILRRMHEQKKKVEALRGEKTEMLGEIYRMLCIHLGVPPKAFTWRYEDADGNVSEAKRFTPLEFYREIVGLNLQEYVMMMDDPTRDYYRLYEIEYDRNMVDQPNWTYVNLPAKELKAFAKASILDGEAMYFSCDVGKQLNRDEGVLSLENYDYESIYGVKFGMPKKDRILTFESGSSHGMALVGVDTSTTGEPVKWLLENSWGSESGHDGYLTMTDAWFDEYMFRLVVHKRFVSPEALAVLEQKPIMLEPWDPMYLPFEDK